MRPKTEPKLHSNVAACCRIFAACTFHSFDATLRLDATRPKMEALCRHTHHSLSPTPPVIVFSSACAGLAGGAVPALAQLVSSSYHSAMSSSGFTRTSSQDDNKHKSRSSTL